MQKQNGFLSYLINSFTSLNFSTGLIVLMYEKPKISHW